MKRTLLGCFLACFATVGLTGCGDPEPTNIAEDVSDAELDAYEAALAEEEAMMDEEEGGMMDDDEN